MRRSLIVIAVAAVAGLVGAAALSATAHPPRVLRSVSHPAGPPPTAGAAASAPAPPPLDAAQIRSTAATWVTAMWTRRPGQGPFAWLDQVAAITSPELLAQLHTARATLSDRLTLSETVDIDGVYPDATNPHTVTVTCVAHVHTATGETDEPCATTVTVAAGAGGQPVVTAAQ